MAKIEIAGSGETFDCPADDTVLRAALRAGLGFPYSCNAGSCGSCRFELQDGEVRHARADAPAWSERDRARGRWLGCQALAGSDCRIRVRLDPDSVSLHRPIRRTMRLADVAPLTAEMSEFVFEIEGPDGFRPGQYALIAPPGVDAPRAYSMCNLPGEGVWRFQIKRVAGGAATSALFDGLQPGDEVACDGPYGTAWLREDAPRDILLIAGGSGLSPMVSIARAAVTSEALAGREVNFLYGCRTPADECGAALLGPLAGFGERLHYVAAVSDPADGDGWSGPTGFVHEVAASQFGERLKDFEIYFAGPPAMAAAVQRQMHEAGVSPERLHFDEFY